MQNHISLNTSAHTTLSTPRTRSTGKGQQSFTNTATYTCGSIGFGPQEVSQTSSFDTFDAL